MDNVVVVEKYPSSTNYEVLFPFEFDKVSLIPERKDKVYKKDISLDIEEVVNKYKYVVLVGAEPCKFVGKITSVTEYQGFLVEDKFLPLMNPMAVKMRPSLEHDFTKAVKDIIGTINGSSKKLTSEYDVVGIDTEREALEHIQYLIDCSMPDRSTEIAMDTETSGLYPRDGYVTGISLSYKAEQGVYIDSMCISDEVVEKLQELIDKCIIIFHNAKFDIKMLQYHFGLTFDVKWWEDTMLEHYTLDETQGTHGLKTLAIKHTDLGDYAKNLDTFKRDYVKKHGLRLMDFTYDLVPFDIMYPYAALDTAATWELHQKFKTPVNDNPKLKVVYERLLKEGTDFLIDVEENGIPINIEKVKRYISDIDHEILELTESMYEFKEIVDFEATQGSPFNVNSPKQKALMFFSVLGLPSVKKTATGADSTDIEVINELAKLHPLPRIINNIMKLKKTKSTYLEKFLAGTDRDGHLRTNFNLQTTSSGRLSSSGKINAQQLPRDDKRPKKSIEAKEGYKIVSQDLKTAEMYIAAVLSGDKVLQQIFIDGQDYHGTMAVNKFDLPCSGNDVAKLYPDKRQAAKTISFEILYKLNYREPALKKFPVLKKWLQAREVEIKKNGYIYSHFGRKRRLPDVFSPNKSEAQHHVRSGINFLVQSVSSDVNLLAGIDMQVWIKENGYTKDMKIWGLVHDSILAEVREELVDLYSEKLAYFTQKNRAGMEIPGNPIGLDLEIGDNYAFVDEWCANCNERH